MTTNCPDEERLVDYFEGRLSKKERSELDEHLSECHACLEALVVTKRMFGDSERFNSLEPVPTSVTQAALDSVPGRNAKSLNLLGKAGQFAKDTVSKLTDTLQPGKWGVLQPVPVRGDKTVISDDFIRLTAAFKHVRVEIEIEKTGIDTARIRVHPKVSPEQVKRYRVTLKSGSREVASYPLEGSYAVFEDIPFGHYGISLTEDDKEVDTYLFEIKDTPHGGEESK